MVSAGAPFEAVIDGHLIATDKSWRGRIAPYERPAHRGWTGVVAPEIVDGRELPWGWTGPGFDDRGWLRHSNDACRSRVPPPNRQSSLRYPAPSEPPPLTERLGEARPGRRPRDHWEGAEWTTHDLGRIVNGHARLTVEADAGTVFELLGRGGPP